MTATQFCFVRHGETSWNAERRLQGHLDIPLNEKGKKQASLTARGLSAHRFDRIYSSDLLRTRETAQHASEALGVAIQVQPALRERHFGLFQGMTYQEAEQKHPEAYRRFHGRDEHYTPPEGGESLLSLSLRVKHCLEAIARQHPGEKVLIVTHGGVLDVVHRLATGKDLASPRDFTIPNAALNWLEWQNGHWAMLEWADQSHLDQNGLDEL